MGKNNNAAVWKKLEEDGLANIQAVEIETSTQDKGQWFPSRFFGGRNEYVRDEQYHPVIDVTVHGKNGKKEHRQKVNPESYYADPKEARRIANEEAQGMWKRAKEKGVPVIMRTGERKQVPSETKSAAYLQWEYQMQQKAIEDAYMESPKGKIALVLTTLVMFVVAVVGCYGLLFIMQWLGM